MKKVIVLLIMTVFALNLFAQKKKDVLLIVGATTVPHGEILAFIKDDMAKAGINLKVIEFTDYVTPNIALNEKSIDANFFQHKPYLDSFVEDRNMLLVALAGIHIEPLGLYSFKFNDIKNLKDGATIAIPNDPTNEGRALLLLEAGGLIKLDGKGGLKATPRNIVDNPKKLKFRELEAAMLPRILGDVDGAVINGNYALPAKLNPVKDAVILEGSKSPYVNIIAIRAGDEADPRLQTLVKVLKTEKVKKFILDKYNGAVVPVF